MSARPYAMPFTARPELVGSFGMVATTHWLASSTAMAMLERGGNAFDAAVAAGFVLQVAEPHLCGPGGDLPIIFWSERDQKTQVLCAQGVSAEAATIEHHKSLGFDIMPATGLLATVVPGAWDGWLKLLRDHGTMSLHEVLEPALGYALNGCPLVPRIIDTIGQVKDLFLEEWPSSAAVWLPGGDVPDGEKLFANPELARLWRRLLDGAQSKRGREAQIDEARRLWYRGFVADAIDKFIRSTPVMDSSGRRNHGLLTAEDMANWEATYDDPVSLDYGRHTVHKAGFWSQGPVFLQSLALLKGFDLSAMDPYGPDFIHTVVEAMKLAFADREGFYGDPNFVDVPGEALLSDGYADARRELIGAEASKEMRPGTIAGKPGWRDLDAVGRDGRAPEFAAGRGSGEPTVRRNGATGGDTCHVDVVDRWGNMVACMPSGGWLQSSPVIPGLGFALNTRGQMFYLDPASPAALGPKRRPRTTLTPSLAFRDGKPYMAFGSPGGDQQDQWQLMLFLRHVHHNLNLQEAIEAPMLTSEHWPNSFWPRQARPARLVLESRFPEATVQELKARGHDIEVTGPWSLGRLVAVSKNGPVLKAGANPRGMQGYAVGR